MDKKNTWTKNTNRLSFKRWSRQSGGNDYIEGRVRSESNLKLDFKRSQSSLVKQIVHSSHYYESDELRDMIFVQNFTPPDFQTKFLHRKFKQF